MPIDDTRSKLKNPKAAEVASAGTYFGSSLALKTLVEISPEELANATMTAATTARLDSLGVLLEYHALTRTDGAKAPVVSKKQAK